MKVFVAVTLALTTSLLAQTPTPSVTSGKHPFTFEDMMKLKRVGAPVPSPDGKWVLFDAEDVDLEANTKISHLWVVPATGGESRRLNPTTNHEERPRFSPDGKRLIWTSKATDPTQIWMCDFDTNAGALVGQPHQVTNISTGADGGIWSPDGKNIVFVSSVYPDCKDDACNKKRDDELKNSKVKAKIFTRLFYRHWNTFTEFKRSHLFVVLADARGADILSAGQAGVSPAEVQTPDKMSGSPTAGTAAPRREPRDLTPGDHDVPPFHIGGQDVYAISPDGQEVAYTSNIDEVEATSTNNEIFVVPISGGTAKKISTSLGSDSTPLYSPDGKYIAWRSQARPGFESDKWRLLVQDRQSGKTRDLTEKFERSVGSFTWASNSDDLFYSAEAHGEAPIFMLIGIDNGVGSELVRAHTDDLVCSKDGRHLFFTVQSISAPNEIGHIPLMSGEIDVPGVGKINPTGVTISVNTGLVDYTRLTHMNDALLSQIDMRPLESFTFKGANNEEVQGFMVKPPVFDPNKKYPLKFLIHGGPQGAWGNSWTYRWNAELFAAPSSPQSVGRDSVEPGSSATSPGGSTESPYQGRIGPGERRNRWICRGNDQFPRLDRLWAEVYRFDQRRLGRETVCRSDERTRLRGETYPFIDKNREAALGASYGGWMTNWLLGHTDRFKCIVSHDGMFNTESAYGTTEELWFPEWEFKGPPWKQRELYRKFSPHLFAEKFKTPTLVVHGQNDYRLDVSEGFQLFTALQRLKVPSKMLYFSDEGHWVLKPQNSRLWYKTVNDWVDQWCK